MTPFGVDLDGVYLGYQTRTGTPGELRTAQALLCLLLSDLETLSVFCVCAAAEPLFFTNYA